MVNYYLKNPLNAEKLVSICRKFHEDINVIYGRQIVDGKSILGVMSFIGNTVSMEIITENQKSQNVFSKKIDDLKSEVIL